MRGSPSAQAAPRLGVVTTSYPRESGDPAGAFVHGFSRWLAAQGAIVEVVAAGPGAATVDGLPVHRLPGHDLFYDGGAPDALARDPRAWLAAAAFQGALARALHRWTASWDGAVSHWLVPASLATALTLPGRRPHLAIGHSSDLHLLRRSKIGRALVRALARRADLVYSGPHLVVDGAPGRVVAMGVELPPGGDRRRGRERFLLHRTTALFLGRLVPVKGLPLLLAALPPSLDLVIAGAGPEAAAVAAAAAPRGEAVRLVGEVRGEAKADLLAACDLLVLPSRRLADGREEGTATVIGEALQAGLPVVATRTGGAAAVLRDGVDGLLVEPEVAALRAALVRLAEDEGLRIRLGAAARLAGGAWSWEAVGPRLVGDRLGALLRRAVRTA